MAWCCSLDPTAKAAQCAQPTARRCVQSVVTAGRVSVEWRGGALTDGATMAR
jgi:hypothetical protein